MRRVNLHNLRCFIRHNPGATAADYAKDIRDRAAVKAAYQKAYESSR